TAYDRHRLALGLPDGSRDIDVEKSFLLECGFDELHGIDYEKGCYVGQELTARTHYRGAVRWRLLPVRIDGPPPPRGAPLHLAEAEVGEMRSAQGGVGLALIRLDRLEAARGHPLASGESRLTVDEPAWLSLPRA
ncbi:MAG: folate-binding protein YgfZ, partial [Alphaproteobacteria bacterium]|nr:folate-binding protein YgfZ [Alphaproteobacteria bacterium]